MRIWSLTAILVTGATFLWAPACSNNDGAGDGDLGGSAGDGDGDDTGGTSGDGDGDGTGGMSGDGDGGLGGQGGEGGSTVTPDDATSECVSYCDLWFMKECDQAMQVSTIYGDEGTCLEACAGFSHDGSDGSLKGDSVQCRIAQLELATAQGIRCNNAEETPKAQCTGDPQ